MGRLKPTKFTDVAMEGAFWRERLDTVLTRTIPSQHVRLKEYGILEFAEAAAAASAAPLPASAATACRPRCSGTPTSASGSRRRAMPSRTGATSDDRGADRRHRRRSRQGAAARRLPQLLVSRPRARQALDQSPRQARALLRRPPARRRDRLLSRRPDGGGCSTSCCAMSTTSRACSDRTESQKHGYCGHQEIELALVKLYRRHRRPEAPRSRRLFHRRARRSSRTISTSRRWRAATTRRNTGSRPTSTASRTCRSASRTRSSAMRCAPCTCTRRWPTSPPSSTTQALKRACERLWQDVTGKRMYVTAGLGPSSSNEGFTAGLRPAQRHRLCRDLRLGRADLLGAAHAQSRLRRQIRRRDGARALQRRAHRPLPRRRRTISTRTSSRATAATSAGTGTPAPAAR